MAVRNLGCPISWVGGMCRQQHRVRHIGACENRRSGAESCVAALQMHKRTEGLQIRRFLVLRVALSTFAFIIAPFRCPSHMPLTGRWRTAHALFARLRPICPFLTANRPSSTGFGTMLVHFGPVTGNLSRICFFVFVARCCPNLVRLCPSLTQSGQLF